MTRRDGALEKLRSILSAFGVFYLYFSGCMALDHIGQKWGQALFCFSTAIALSCSLLQRLSLLDKVHSLEDEIVVYHPKYGNPPFDETKKEEYL